MRIPILSARSGWHVEELRRAFRERDHEAVEVRYEHLRARFGRETRIEAGGVCLSDAAAVLPRIIPDGSLEQLICRVDLLHALEERGVCVVNPAATIERTVDKGWTTALLAAAGLPTPETVVCESVEAAIQAFREMQDVILKPLFGSMGLGMLRLKEEEAAWRVFRTVERIRGVFYLQKAIDHGGRDLRAFVAGDRVIAAIERQADGWCTSVARGARPKAIRLDEERTRLAITAAKAVGAIYAGVDLIDDRQGQTWVIEVNGIPGWRGLQQTTDIDVAGAIADEVLQRAEVKRRRSEVGR